MSFDENDKTIMAGDGPEEVNPSSGQFIEVEPVTPVEPPPFEPVSNVLESTPYNGEPVTSGSAPSFDTPVSNEPPKKDNKKLWIIIAIVLVVLCCCCLLIVIIAASSSDMLEDLYYEFSRMLINAPSFAKAWLVG